MEKVQGTENTIEIFENDIDYYLEEFRQSQNIESYRAVPQSVWNGALRYIYNHVFKPNPDALKQKANININNNKIPSNCNAYNYPLVMDVLDYYIYNMCMVNNKEVSIIGFTTLTGISESEIYEWGNNGVKLSPTASEIYKKLNLMREESLSNKLADGKQNPVGVIAMLNRHYGWNMPGVSRETASKPQASITDIQQRLIELSQNKPQFPYNGQ